MNDMYPTYVVVQTGEIKDQAACALLQPQGWFPEYPLTLSVPLGWELGVKRGDVFRVSEITPTTIRHTLVHNRSKVNIRAEAVPIWSDGPELFVSLGILTGRTRPKNAQQRQSSSARLRNDDPNQGKPILEVCGLAVPIRLSADQVIGGTPDDLYAGLVVQVSAFPLPRGSRCSHSYWLPPNFPQTENWAQESQVGRGVTDIHVASIEALTFDSESLTLPMFDDSSVEWAETSVALANHVYANAIKETARVTAVTAQLVTEPPTVEEWITEAAQLSTMTANLAKVRPTRDEFGRLVDLDKWSMLVRWPEMEKAMAFANIWKSDTPIRVHGDELTPEYCVEGTITSVISLGQRSYEVEMSLSSCASQNARVDVFELMVACQGPG